MHSFSVPLRLIPQVGGELGGDQRPFGPGVAAAVGRDAPDVRTDADHGEGFGQQMPVKDPLPPAPFPERPVRDRVAPGADHGRAGPAALLDQHLHEQRAVGGAQAAALDLPALQLRGLPERLHGARGRVVLHDGDRQGEVRLGGSGPAAFVAKDMHTSVLSVPKPHR